MAGWPDLALRLWTIHTLGVCMVNTPRCSVNVSGYFLVQDNDPKHCSAIARDFYMENDIDWWKIPPESPDLNPIQYIWHELKEYIHVPSTQGQRSNWSTAFYNSGEQ